MIFILGAYENSLRAFYAIRVSIAFESITFCPLRHRVCYTQRILYFRRSNRLYVTIGEGQERHRRCIVHGQTEFPAERTKSTVYECHDVRRLNLHGERVCAAFYYVSQDLHGLPNHASNYNTYCFYSRRIFYSLINVT